MGKPSARGFDGDDVHPDREYVVAANIGHRSWYLDDFDKPLRSMTWQFRWDGRGVHTAINGRDLEYDGKWIPQVPRIDNNFGFYGYYSVRDEYDAGFVPHESIIRVSGLIEGFGRSVVGTQGFRSEKAVISAFCMEECIGLPDETEQIVWAGGFFLAPPAIALPKAEVEKVHAYLERFYPTVPIFNTVREMVSIIPMSSKPTFT